MSEVSQSPTAGGTAVHRVGGAGVESLRLKPREELLVPPGISVLLGDTPAAAAEQMRQAFPDPRKFARIHELAQTVGSTTIALVEAAGFRVVPDPSLKFPNHARLSHAAGVAGFTEENLQALSRVFVDTETPRA